MENMIRRRRILKLFVTMVQETKGYKLAWAHHLQSQSLYGAHFETLCFGQVESGSEWTTEWNCNMI